MDTHTHSATLKTPEAISAARSISKINCINTFEQNKMRIEYFKERVKLIGLNYRSVTIFIANATDVNGRTVAQLLAPNFDADEVHEQGMIPFARGIANYDFVQDILNKIDVEAASKLSNKENLAVVVIDHGVAEVFDA